jgi:hypothetical protein
MKMKMKGLLFATAMVFVAFSACCLLISASQLSAQRFRDTQLVTVQKPTGDYLT